MWRVVALDQSRYGVAGAGNEAVVERRLEIRLHECGLLGREKRGVWVYYQARTEALANLAALIGTPALAST